MAVPESKVELLNAIDKNFALLIKKLANVAADKAFKPVMEGHAKGAVISVAQLVCYLIGWGELVLTWHDKERVGELIDFPETGYKWNQLGLLAQKFYQDYQHITGYDELLERLTKNKQKLVALVEQFSDQELYGQPWYGKWTRGRMIQFNTSSPYSNVSGRLNKVKDKIN